MENTINKILKEIKEEEEKEINKIKNQFKGYSKEFKKLYNLIKKYKNKKTFTEEELKEIFSILCFKNLAFCCGIEKTCYKRDTVLYVLGISKEEFAKRKIEMIEKWLKERGTYVGSKGNL